MLLPRRLFPGSAHCQSCRNLPLPLMTPAGTTTVFPTPGHQADLSEPGTIALTGSRTPKTRKTKVLGPLKGGLAPSAGMGSEAHLSLGTRGCQYALSPLPHTIRECSLSQPPGHQARCSQRLPLSPNTALCGFCVNARSFTNFHASWYYAISAELIGDTVPSAQAVKLGSGSALKAFPDLGPFLGPIPHFFINFLPSSDYHFLPTSSFCSLSTRCMDVTHPESLLRFCPSVRLLSQRLDLSISVAAAWQEVGGWLEWTQRP